MNHNTRTMPFELIMDNRSLHSVFLHTLRCAHSGVTWWLNKDLILNNADSVIRTREFRNSIDDSVAIDFEKMKIRTAKAPSVFLRGVLRGKISHISADYCGEAWSSHNVKRDRGMIECQKNFLKKILSRFDLEAWISFSPSIVKHVIQSICHSGFSSNIQIIVADVFNQTWTSAWSNNGAWLLIYDECLEIGHQ